MRLADMPNPIAARRRAGCAAVMVLSAMAFSQAAAAAAAAPTPAIEHQRIEVGPSRDVKTIGAAAILARDGAVIEVDAGEYRGDVAVWARNDLSLRAVGGRVRLVADGRSAEAKAIWVVRAERMTVEGFDFSGAKVPDLNGAGIRLERGSLRVHDCSFTHNENGILTGNQADTVLEIENSEFGHNGAGDGYSHNLYAGTIARLSVTGSYFHHADQGHLLKSRAASSSITYNRLTDESDGKASYELEFPNGGVAYVIGNVIQQGTRTENFHLISFGAEGYRWPANALYLVNNTLIDDLPRRGVFLRVSPGEVAVRVINNLLVGDATWDIGVAAIFRNNPTASRRDFVDPAAGDFRLKASASARGKAGDAGSADGMALRPAREYRHPAGSEPLATAPVHPGAMQTVATEP